MPHGHCYLWQPRLRGTYIVADTMIGTGYSTLSHLKVLPIDIVKIDRHFVRDIGTDPDDTTIIAIIIHMYHGLQLKVLAEGVENAEQLAFLRSEGRGQIQGNLVSPPLPANEFAGFLAEWKHRLPGGSE